MEPKKTSTESLSSLRTRSFTWGLVFFTLVIVFVFSESVGENRKIPELTTFSQYAIHLCTTLSILFWVSILMESKHWMSYYNQHISDVIVNKEYLIHLKRERLKETQTDVLKALYHFKGDDIKGTSLQHIQESIQPQIQSPFKRSFTNTVTITLNDPDDAFFMVRDTFSWQSKKGSVGEGQKHEDCVIKDFKLSFDPDDLVDYQIHELTTHLKNGDLIRDYTKDIKLSDLATAEKGVHILLSGAEIYSPDDVYVLSCMSSYKIPKSKFFGVKMSYPTKDFKLTIAYPLKHKIYFEYFTQKVPRIQQDAFTYIVHFDGWILANEGFVFQLRSDL